jgi:hypothetical protein
VQAAREVMETKATAPSQGRSWIPPRYFVS